MSFIPFSWADISAWQRLVAQAINPILQWFNAEDSGNNRVSIPQADGTTGLVMDQSGNVGIGTDAPAHKLEVDGSIRTTHSLGYMTGAGGAVTQGTSRTTGVTLDKSCGQITLFSAAGSATPASFTVTNSMVDAVDTIIVNQKSGTDLYRLDITAIGAGSFRITFATTGGTTTEQPVFTFAVIKAVGA